METVLSLLSKCVDKCCDDQPSININVNVSNDREYYCLRRPKEARPPFLRELKRKRSFSVG